MIVAPWRRTTASRSGPETGVMRRGQVQWVGAYPGDDDHGFYRVVVAAFGRRCTERVNRTIDRALDAEGKRLERRYRRRQRARSSSEGPQPRAAR
jgi:hypothetical protein